MNREEWVSHIGVGDKYKYYKLVQKLLKDWMFENNITETCVVHHRNDTDETREYNEEHYELWGYEIDENDNLKFEIGKYVQFMTRVDHVKLHHKGKTLSDEAKSALRAANIGKHHTEETKEKIRIAKSGKTLSEEHKKKISAANTGTNHHFYGKHHTEETKEKLRIANIGKHLTEETKEKLRIANTGKHHTEETKEKISAAKSGANHHFYGKHLSEETCEKLRVASKRVQEQAAVLYRKYKQTGGELVWNDFRRALKNNEVIVNP